MACCISGELSVFMLCGSMIYSYILPVASFAAVLVHISADIGANS
jgi:hypothetical protein